jgi:small-conductance mechanosensitive channel
VSKEQGRLFVFFFNSGASALPNNHFIEMKKELLSNIILIIETIFWAAFWFACGWFIVVLSKTL